MVDDDGPDMSMLHDRLAKLTLFATSTLLLASCTAPYQSEPPETSSRSPSVDRISPPGGIEPPRVPSTNELPSKDPTEVLFRNGVGHVFLPKYIEIPDHGPPRVVFDQHKTRIDAQAYKNLDTGGRIDTLIPVYEVGADGKRTTAILSTLAERKPHAIRPIMLKLLDNGTYSLVLDHPDAPSPKNLPDHRLYVQYRRDVMIHTRRHDSFIVNEAPK
jgi:hypothetical protein